MESIWGIVFRHGPALRQSGKRRIGADVWFPGSPATVPGPTTRLCRAQETRFSS